MRIINGAIVEDFGPAINGEGWSYLVVNGVRAEYSASGDQALWGSDDNAIFGSDDNAIWGDDNV